MKLSKAVTTASAIGDSTSSRRSVFVRMSWKIEARDAVLCYFDDDSAPKVIRLHLVKDTLIAV